MNPRSNPPLVPFLHHLPHVLDLLREHLLVPRHCLDDTVCDVAVVCIQVALRRHRWAGQVDARLPDHARVVRIPPEHEVGVHALCQLDSPASKGGL
jgi:hypothetical protein